MDSIGFSISQYKLLTSDTVYIYLRGRGNVSYSETTKVQGFLSPLHQMQIIFTPTKAFSLRFSRTDPTVFNVFPFDTRAPKGFLHYLSHVHDEFLHYLTSQITTAHAQSKK